MTLTVLNVLITGVMVWSWPIAIMLPRTRTSRTSRTLPNLPCQRVLLVFVCICYFSPSLWACKVIEIYKKPSFRTALSSSDCTQISTFVGPCIIVQFIKKDPTRCNNVSNFIIPYLYEAQHVLGDTPPITRNLKLHRQPLVFHTWKVVRRVVGGRCQTHSAWQRPPTTRPNNLPRMKNQRLSVQF